MPKINCSGNKCRLVATIVQLSVVVKLVTFTTTYVGAKLIINSAVKWMYLDQRGSGPPSNPSLQQDDPRDSRKSGYFWGVWGGHVEPEAVIAQKFWGGGHCPISPFITECIFSVLRNWKNTNFI